MWKNKTTKLEEIVDSAIGEMMVFKDNKLTGCGSINIAGEFNGDIMISGAVHVGAKGKVVGNISADSLDVEGVVHGDVDAAQSVRVYETGKLYGSVRSAELVVNTGGLLRGECWVGEEPSKDEEFPSTDYDPGEADNEIDPDGDIEADE